MPTPENPAPGGKDQKHSGPTPPHRGRPERSSGSNLIWYLLGAAAIFVVINVWYTHRSTENELTFGEFVEGIKNQTYRRDNVFKLKMGPGMITFQSQPDGSSR